MPIKIVLGLLLFVSSNAMANPLKGNEFVDPKVCGGCHPRQYNEWVGSMHHYAQVSPFNEWVNDFLWKKTGKTVGAFCVQCHTPIGTVSGEPYALPNTQRSLLALSGVSCDVCHSMNKAHGSSQAFFGLKPGPRVFGPMGKMGKESPDTGSGLFHQTEQRGLFQSSELCRNCHEVIVPNGLRLQETYSEWENSPWAEEGVQCQNCHMSSTPGRPAPYSMGLAAEVPDPELPQRPISNHSFIGVDHHWTDDYPLRSVDGSAPDPRTQKRNIKLQEALKQKRNELMRHAARVQVTPPASLPLGGQGTLGVRIENTSAGHHFPTGFPWRQAWLEVTLTDAKGVVFFQSGDLDRQGDLRNGFSRDVQEGKAKRDKYLVNLQTQITVRGFRGNDVEVKFPLAEEDAPAPTIFPAVTPQAVYNGAENARMIKRGIPARESRRFSFPIQIPKDITGPVTYSVRLLYRNFPAYYFDYLAKPYPALQETIMTMKEKLETYEVDQSTGEILIRD